MSDRKIVIKRFDRAMTALEELSRILEMYKTYVEEFEKDDQLESEVNSFTTSTNSVIEFMGKKFIEALRKGRNSEEKESKFYSGLSREDKELFNEVITRHHLS